MYVCLRWLSGEAEMCTVAFNPSSQGQVAVVMYEWADVKYLGVQTPDQDQSAGLPVRHLASAYGCESD